MRGGGGKVEMSEERWRGGGKVERSEGRRRRRKGGEE